MSIMVDDSVYGLDNQCGTDSHQSVVHRARVVGLGEENFYLTEGKRPVLQQKLIGAASNNKIEDLTIVIDRSKESLLTRLRKVERRFIKDFSLSQCYNSTH